MEIKELKLNYIKTIVDKHTNTELFTYCVTTDIDARKENIKNEFAFLFNMSLEEILSINSSCVRIKKRGILYGGSIKRKAIKKFFVKCSNPINLLSLSKEFAFKYHFDEEIFQKQMIEQLKTYKK